MDYRHEDAVKSFVLRYQQKVLALVACLIGGGQDKAYEVAAASFTEALRAADSAGEAELFIAVIGNAVRKSRDVQVVPDFGVIESMDISHQDKRLLAMLQRALQTLPFDTKMLILLRDQLHLSYRDIAELTQIPEQQTRLRLEEARVSLRQKTEEVLHGKG